MILSFTDNPLDNFVVLPDTLKDLQYSNVIPGAIKGALMAVGLANQVNVASSCEFVKDRLRGDNVNAVRVTIKPSGFEDLKDYQE